MVRSKRELKEIMENLIEASFSMGLYFNVQKLNRIEMKIELSSRSRKTYN